MIVALVLSSALLHALWNALLRVERDKDRALIAAVGLAMVLAAIVAGIRWLVGDQPFATGTALAWSVIAGLAEWAYFTTLARAIDSGPLGLVYTVSRGGAILVVWPASIGLYGEAISTASIAGSAVVLGGLALTSAGSSDPRHPQRGALAWAIACAIAIAGYHLAYKAALRTGGSPSAVFAVALAVATAINVARIGRAGRRATAAMIAARPARVVLMGVVCGSSFLILLEALSGGGAGFVLTLRNTSVLFAIALAAAIGERPRAPQVAGAALVAGGAILMAWP